MATIDIGKIKPVFKGTYDNSTAYVLDDIVYYNGSSYVAKTSTTGNLPTDTTKWNILASGSGGIWDSNLSIGSTGQVVKVSSGGALEFGTLSSDYVKLGEATCSGASDLHVDLFSADYDTYIVFMHQVSSSSTGYNFKVQFNTASNTPQTSSAYRYILDGWYWNNSNNNTAQRVGGWNQPAIELSPLPNTPDNHNCHILTFFRPYSASTRTGLSAQSNGHENNHIYCRTGQGYYNGNEQHTGFTITSGSGTLTIPSLKVYGLK